MTVSVAEREPVCAECQGRGYSHGVIDTVWDDVLEAVIPLFGLCQCVVGQSWVPLAPEPQAEAAAEAKRP